MNQESNYIYRNGLGSQLVRMNAVLFNKQLNSRSDGYDDDLYKQYERFLEVEDPYKFMEEPYKRLADSVLKKEYGNDPTRNLYYDALDLTASYTFSTELRSGFQSANKLLRNVFGSTFFEEFTGNDRDVFDENRNSLFSNVFNRTTNTATHISSENTFSSAFEQPLSELVNRELMSAPYSHEKASRELDDLNREYSLNETMKYLGTGYLEDYLGDANAVSRTKAIFDRIDYVTKPGILPAVGLIEGANRELYIDIYQLQNPVIRDFITTKIIQRVRTSTEKYGGFTLKVRMADPLEQNASETAYNILGPNLIFAESLGAIQRGLTEDERKRVNIEVKWAGKRSHPKYMLSDSAASIGTANLTEPMGTSVRQAGSNYENVRILHFNMQFRSNLSEEIAVPINAKVNFLTRFDELSRVKKYEDVIEQLSESSNYNINDIDSSTNLYLQARYLKRHFDDKRMPVSTGLPNIGGPSETYQVLKSTLNAVRKLRTDNKNAVFYGFLNQVFLLDYVTPDLKNPYFDPISHKTNINSQIAGEMGDDSSAELFKWTNHLEQKAERYRDEIQKPLFDLLITGGAKVIVDPHNYQEKLINPIYEQLKKKTYFQDNRYDLKRMLRDVKGDDADTKIRYLAGKLDGDEHLSRMILALFSGNVQVATVPFLHSKMFAGYLFNEINSQNEMDILKGATLIGGKEGSNNLSIRSLSPYVRDIPAAEAESTNSELDLLFFRNEYMQSSRMQNILTEDQQKEEHFNFSRMIAKTMTEVSRMRFGQLNYTDVDQQELHRKSIDRQKVEELFDSLNKLSNEARYGLNRPFKVYREFDDSGIKEVIVDIDKGPNLRFTVVGDNVSTGGKYSVMAVDQGRMINRIAVTNMSDNDLTLGLGVSDDTPNTPLKLRTGQKAFIDPIQATISLVATLALERDQIRYIKNPIDYIQRLNLTQQFSFDSHTSAMQQNAMMGFLSNVFDLRLDAYRAPLGTAGLTDITVLLKSGLAQKRAMANLLTFFNDLQGSNSVYSAIRDIAEINIDDKTRRDQIGNFVRTVGDWLQNPTDTRLSRMYGEMQKMFASEMFADFRYAFVSKLDNYVSDSDLNNRLKEVQEKLFEPFLLPTQQRVYSTSQSRYQLPLFGIPEEAAYITDIMNEAYAKSENGGYNNLKSRAIMAVPYAFGPNKYLGEGPETFVKVAEGGSSQFVLDNPYKQYIPFVRVGQGKTGTLYDMNIINEARVGMTVNKQLLEEYLSELPPEALLALQLGQYKEIDKILNKNVNYVAVNFKSLDQTAQRLKNTLGLRPMLYLSTDYQAFLERTVSGDFTQTVVEGYLKEKFGFLSDDALQKVRNIEGESIRFGAMFSGQLSTFLGPAALELALQIEADVRKEYKDVQGLTEEEMDSFVAEILRMRAINNELFGVTKGLITASNVNNAPPVMLVALGGGFSDYGYSNPFYGAISYDPITKLPVNPWDGKEWRGLRTGWLDQATKSVKASLMAVNFDELEKTGLLSVTSNNMNLLSEGDRALYDLDQGVAIILDSQGNTKKVITSRGELDVIGNAIEKAGSSSVGMVTASSNALTVLGEQGIEHVFQKTFLQGSTASNEVRTHIGYIRTVLGAVRRIDATGGGLVKSPMAPGGFGLFNLIYEQIQGKLDVTKEQIFGLFSLSNIKAYTYEHGSTLLTSQSATFKSMIDNLDGKKLVASLLIGFHSKHFEHINNEELNKVYNQLYEIAKTSKDQALGKYFDGLVRINEMFSQKLGAREFFTKFTPNDDYSPLAAAKIKAISLEMLVNALDGKDQDLKDLIKSITLGEPGFESKLFLGQKGSKNYISLRERAFIASQLDIMTQVMDPTYVRGVPLVPSMSTKDRLTNPIAMNAYHSLGAIAGVDDLGGGEPDPLTGAILEASMNNFPVIRIFAGNSPGQTKPPGSKKKTANIEMQELLANQFNINAEVFRQKGRLDNMRKVVTSIYGFMTNMSAYEFTDVYNAEVLDLVELSISHLDDPHNKKAAASRLSNQILGYYANTDINKTDLYKRAKILNMFAFLDWDRISKQELQRMIKKMQIDPKVDKGKFATESALMRELLKIVRIDKYTKDDIKEQVADMYFENVDQMRRIAHQYDVNPDKPLGIMRGETIVSSLIERGFQTTSFMFPTLSKFAGTPNGKVAVTVDYQNSQMGIFLGPKAVRVLGEQFAGFQSELAKSAIALYEVLTPHSPVFKAFRKIQLQTAKMSQSNKQLVNVYLNQDEAEALYSFQENAQNFFRIAAEELSGRYVQEILGNKVRAPGSTVVGIGSWFAMSREAVVPQSFNDRFKIADPNDPRFALAQQFVDELGRYDGNKMAQKYLMSGLDMLMQGMSNKKAVIEAFKTQSNTIREQILNSENQNVSLDKYREIRRNIRRLIKSKDSYSYQGEGDQYLKVLFETETKYLTALATKMYYTHSSDIQWWKGSNTIKKYDAAMNQIEYAESLPTIFTGFLGTASNRQGLLPEQLEGKLGGFELHKNVLININMAKKDKQMLIEFVNQLKIGVDTYTQNLVEKLGSVIDREDVRETSSAVRVLNEFSTKLNNTFNELVSNTSTSPNLRLTRQLELDIIEHTSKIKSHIVNVKRSPPPGFLHISVTGNVISTKLDDINERIRRMSDNLDDNFDFFGSSDGSGRTTGLFHPIAYLAPNLGDFDGDAMSIIFSGINELEMQVDSTKARLSRINNKRNKLNEQIKNRWESHVIEKLQKQITDLNEEENRLKMTLAQNENRIQLFKQEDQYSNFDKVLKDWISNYGKLDREFVEQFNTSTVLTFVTQTKGLFPYMNDSYNRVRQLHSSFKEVLTQFKGDSESKYLIDYIKKNNASDNAQFRLVNEALEYAEAVDKSLIEAIASAQDEGQLNSAIGGLIGQIGQDLLTRKNVNKLTQLGESRLIDMPSFERMNQVLGKAGSVLLGKTYNNTIGLLYQQSPLLALAGAVEKDTGFRQMIQKELIKHKQGEGAAWVPDFLDKLQIKDTLSVEETMSVLEGHARTARSKVEQLGGFIQQIHQLMRDSIKPKSDLTGFLTNIEKRLDDYAKAGDEVGRDKVLSELSRELAVEPLYKFDRLMSSLKDINVDIKEDRTFRTEKTELDGERREIEEQYFIKLGEILGKDALDVKQDYNRFHEIHRTMDSEGKGVLDHLKQQGVNEGVVVATYEVKKGLVNAAATFAYENVMKDNTLLTNKFEDLMGGLKPERINHLNKLVNSLYSPTVNSGDIEIEEFKQFAQDNLKDLLKAINNKDTKGAEQGRNKLLAAAMEFSKSREHVNSFFGQYGEKLFNLYNFNKIRSDQAGSKQDSLDRLGYDPTEDHLLGLVYQGMQTGKLNTPEALAKVFMGLANIFNANGDGSASSMLQTLVQNLSKGVIVETEVTTGEKGAVDLLGAILTAAGSEDNARLLLDETRAMSLGNMSDTTKAFISDINQYTVDKAKAGSVNAAENVSKMYDVSKEQNTLQNQLEKYYGKEEAEKISKHFTQIINPNFFVDQNVEDLEEEMTRIVQANMRESKDDLNYKMFLEEGRNVSVLTEIGLFPMLALVGNLIASSDPTGEQVSQMIQQTVGNSLMAYSYNYSSNSALGQMLGAGFKVRMVTSGQENPMMQVVNLVTQEALGIYGYKKIGELSQSVGKWLKVDEMTRDFKGNTLDVEMNKGLRIGLQDITMSTLAGAAHMVVSSVINKVFNLGQSQQDKYRDAIEKSVEQQSPEERALDQVVEQYNTTAYDNAPTEDVEQEQEQIQSDGTALNYEIEQQYVSHYVEMSDGYQSVDEGYEAVLGYAEPDLLSLAM